MVILISTGGVEISTANSYTGVFMKPRNVTKLRTLGQLRHRSVANRLLNNLTGIDNWSRQLHRLQTLIS